MDHLVNNSHEKRLGLSQSPVSNIDRMMTALEGDNLLFLVRVSRRASYRDIRMVDDGEGNFRVDEARRGELARVDSVEARPAGPDRVEASGTLIPGSHARYQSIGTIEVEDFSEL